MVEVLRIPQSVAPHDVPLPLSPAPNRVRFAPTLSMMTREEHQLKEMNLKKMGLRRAPPKRSATVQNFIPFSDTSLSQPANIKVPPMAGRKILPPLGAVVSAAKPAPAAVERMAAVEFKKPMARRPIIGTPRRSYSVMDYEPVPQLEQPSKGVKLSDLPTELHFAIFDNLDPIDSVCIGLTSRHFYTLHRHVYRETPKMPLNTRRQGPNNVEWAWRLANQIANLSVHPEHVEKAITHLESYAIRGAIYCRKCGAHKCELYRHIKEWMGNGWEYCAITGKFTRPAPAGARDACYRRKPTDPHACGRHRKQPRPGINRTTTI